MAKSSDGDELARRIEESVRNAPPLTTAQRGRLAEIFRKAEVEKAELRQKVAESRVRQGLPPVVEDDATLSRVASLLNPSQSQPPLKPSAVARLVDEV